MNNIIINPNNPSHPLIAREQTYLLDRKILSIHSEDRDISQWPNPNNFAVTLPEDLINIQSMRLVTSSFPNNQYVFTENYQNTKLQFTVTEPHASIDGEQHALLSISADILTAEIHEGFYEPAQLATELGNALNNAVSAAISIIYDNFVCQYNEVNHKIYIGNNRDGFVLNFDEEIQYDISCGILNVWNNYIKWGLPYYLGYQKKVYTPILYTDLDPFSYGFTYETTDWIKSERGMVAPYKIYISEPPCTIDIFGDNTMYMELEKYNSIDEIQPYSDNTMSTYNNDYHGNVNSAFAKIPLLQFPFSQINDSRNAYLTNVKVFNPPLPKLRRMKFKFRYHDGRLVEFKCVPFTFSIEINQLRDEQERVLSVRVPNAYSL